jgi:hypothetical protein
MLCIRLKSFDRACQATSGGVSRVWIFDRDDFNWTQAADDADGSKGVYTAVALRAGATLIGGSGFFPVDFQYLEAEYKYAQSKKGASVKYEHSLEMMLPDIGQFITTWNNKVDAAGACCGIGILVELYSGKMLVLGEKWVNAASIPEWRMAQDGSTATSGKLTDDENGQTTILKGDYVRSAYEYTGGVASITALEADDAS